jgi:AraC-like DNA-binding protein/ligand-binding sensor protein
MKRQKAALSETLKQEFKKDLELFQYFLVLLNSSSPIRNVELMWADDLELFDPTQRPRLNTGDALVQLQHASTDTQGRTSPSPSTHFCDMVHGFGAYEEQTCAKSDKPAKELCRATGRSHVYPCHVGLTDIAVPVICEGEYLGTLFSGQVVTEPPTAERFAQVKEALKDQPHIDLNRLEEAYWRVPVVTTAQLAEMVRMLELFARYLSNAWKRLEIMSEFQHVRERELALDRRELAEKLLSGQLAGRTPDHLEQLRTLARNVGLERLPDRLMVLRMHLSPEAGAGKDWLSDETAPTSAEGIGKQLALARVTHSIEDRCRSWPNTLAAVTAPGEMCIFTSQKSRTASHERQLIDEIGQALLRAARSQGLLTARMGISALHPVPSELLRAYHEAVSALDSGRSTLNWFESLPERQQQPTQALSRLQKALQTAESAAINSSLREFLAAAIPAGASVAQLQQARGLLTWACEHLAREMSSMAVDPEPVNQSRENSVQLILAAPTSFAMTDAFRAFVEQLRQYVMQLFSQREQKIVGETHRLVRELGPEKVTIQDISQNLKLSAGHLGRVYSRTTGQTLEEYLIRQKLEMGKRLLLDPRLHVSEVSDRCGFCNPAYFASVFKKYMHCTPRAFANQPHRCGDEQRDLAESQAVAG